MSWDKTTHDFGLINRGKHSTKFTYSGDKKIKNVSGSCSCTAIMAKNGVVEVTTNFKRSNINEVKRVTVSYEDGSHDMLTVKARVR